MAIIKFAPGADELFMGRAQLFVAGRFCVCGLIHHGGGDVRAAGHHRHSTFQMDCGKFKVARKLLRESVRDFSSCKAQAVN